MKNPLVGQNDDMDMPLVPTVSLERRRREEPTKCTEITYFFVFFYNGVIVKENKEVYNFSAFSWLVST
jgi:hypothetical protein